MLELPSPEDDGLYIPEVGEWSSDKHFFLRRYIDGFMTSMHDKPQWSGLHYIDLFAGAGIERIRGTGVLEWGSPLVAAQAPYPFSGLHLSEEVKETFEALRARVCKHRPDAQVLYGDANKCIHDIMGQIPEGSLSLAFLDPYGLHLDYDTIAVLARRRADLIIFFPDHLDALRNWETYYLEKPDSNLDRCLGRGADWRALLKATPSDQWAQRLRELYVQQLTALGYTEFEYERIMMNKHPLYVLIFCSKSRMGAKIWKGTSLQKPNGQRTFDFGG